MISEFEIIAKLKEVFGNLHPPDLGMGDDTAVLFDLKGPLLWTTDTSIEKIHFRRDWLAPENIGFRAASASLSDISAMGGCPRYLLVSFQMEASEDPEEILKIAKGIQARAEEDAVRVVGGNISRSDSLALEISALGVTRNGKALTRSGAKPGDRLFVSGYPGLAAFCLEYLQKGLQKHLPKELFDTWASPPSRSKLGQALVGLASSCIDISDGIVQDAGHLAQASCVDLELNFKQLPKPECIRVGEKLARDWDIAAAGPSDDYELLFTISPEHVSSLRDLTHLCPLSEAGEVLREGGQCIQRGFPAHRGVAKKSGWDHFSK